MFSRVLLELAHQPFDECRAGVMLRIVCELRTVDRDARALSASPKWRIARLCGRAHFFAPLLAARMLSTRFGYGRPAFFALRFAEVFSAGVK
jgi:hypothetical protein